MGIDYICREVEGIVRKYAESDPFLLSKAMKVILLFESMGTSDSACKGFYVYQSRKHVITINSDLPEIVQRIILSHELGHAILHWQTAKVSPFRDFSLYDNTSRFEYEANLFAAEFLLQDERVLELLNKDTFFFSAARELCVPPEMLDFKFRILKKKGYQLDSPIMAHSDFLRGMEIPENTDDQIC